MHGHPLIRLLLTLLLLLVLGAGVWTLTRRHSHSPPSAIAQKPAETTMLEITLTASQPWEKCTVQYLDRLLLEGKAAESSQTKVIELPLAKAADLVINASWKEPGNHALRLVAKAQDIPVIDTTLWGDQTLQDAVAIPAQKSP